MDRLYPDGKTINMLVKHGRKFHLKWYKSVEFDSLTGSPFGPGMLLLSPFSPGSPCAHKVSFSLTCHAFGRVFM